MTDPAEILRRCRRIVLHDWRGEDIPEALCRAGFTVIGWGGPRPEDVGVLELVEGLTTFRRTGEPPTAADLIYVFRPVAEAAKIVAEAQTIGATVIWRQSGRNEAGESDPRGCAPDAESAAWRRAVEAAGLDYLEDAYIAAVARQLPADR